MNEPPRQLPCSSNAMSSMSAMPTPVGEAAVDLALDDHRVDPHAAVVDRDEPAHLDLARAGVDVDDADVGAEREGQVRRVVDAARVQLRPRRPRAARGRRGRPCAISWIVLPCVGSPLTNQRPALPLEVVGGHLQHAGGDRAAPARAPCARPAPSPRPDTGVERDCRRCPARTACGRCRRATTSMSSGGMPSSSATIWANVVSWPWPWVCTESRSDRLAGRVHAQLGAVGHAQPEDVHVLARARRRPPR